MPTDSMNNDRLPERTLAEILALLNSDDPKDVALGEEEYHAWQLQNAI